MNMNTAYGVRNKNRKKYGRTPSTELVVKDCKETCAFQAGNKMCALGWCNEKAKSRMLNHKLQDIAFTLTEELNTALASESIAQGKKDPMSPSREITHKIMFVMEDLARVAYGLEPLSPYTPSNNKPSKPRNKRK